MGVVLALPIKFSFLLLWISVRLSIGVCQAQLKNMYKKLEELVEIGKVLRLFYMKGKLEKTVLRK